MRRHRWIAGLAAATLLLAPAGVGAEPQIDGSERERIAQLQGREICFTTAVVLGPIIVQGHRCYTPYLVRTVEGAFLGFGPPGSVLVPPGQTVWINTPPGAPWRGRLLYMIPLPSPVFTIPVGAMRLIGVQVLHRSGRAVIVLPRGTAAEDRALELFPVPHR